MLCQVPVIPAAAIAVILVATLDEKDCLGDAVWRRGVEQQALLAVSWSSQSPFALPGAIADNTIKTPAFGPPPFERQKV